MTSLSSVKASIPYICDWVKSGNEPRSFDQVPLAVRDAPLVKRWGRGIMVLNEGGLLIAELASKPPWSDSSLVSGKPSYDELNSLYWAACRDLAQMKQENEALRGALRENIRSHEELGTVGPLPGEELVRG